jgi:glutamyl-tRNA synthetase
MNELRLAVFCQDKNPDFGSEGCRFDSCQVRQSFRLQESSMSIRVRFAPSPTGQVHIGNIRAAIFNWLFARHHGGEFLLRIEDTDLQRSTPEAVRGVLDALEWLGLNYDAPPVYQTAQLPRHREAVEKLVRDGHAYRGVKGDEGGEVTFFRMPGTDMAFEDCVKGFLVKKAEDLKDFVILRSNGTPVFHLANVVDDITMGITHVIRGDDHVENTFRHIALFRALGVSEPVYAHLPMIINAQGKPYSKRDGAAFVGDFRAKGFLPDALFNFLALLGWSPGGDKEIMTRREMIDLFDFKQVKSSPAQMDMRKFEWMNGEYIRLLPEEEFRRQFRQALEAAGVLTSGTDESYFNRVAALMQSRTRSFPDSPPLVAFFFRDDFAWDEKVVKKRLHKPGAMALLAAMRERFAAEASFTAGPLEKALQTLAAEKGVDIGDIIHPVRVAVSGLGVGPGLFEMLDTLGRERVLDRMAKALILHGGSAAIT